MGDAVSYRTHLVDLLTAALDPARYSVVGSATVPGEIPPGKIAVRVWQTEVARGPVVGGRPSVTCSLVVWVCSPHSDPDRVDDDLDDALADVLTPLVGLRGITWGTATRDVFGAGQETGADWHGYKITVTAGGILTASNT